MVLTLLAITDDYHQDEVLSAARASATAHPSRVIVVSKAGGETRLHAKIQVGEGLSGDLIALKLHGELASHDDSVVLPLLLPDSPRKSIWRKALFLNLPHVSAFAAHVGAGDD